MQEFFSWLFTLLLIPKARATLFTLSVLLVEFASSSFLSCWTSRFYNTTECQHISTAFHIKLHLRPSNTFLTLMLALYTALCYDQYPITHWLDSSFCVWCEQKNPKATAENQTWLIFHNSIMNPVTVTKFPTLNKNFRLKFKNNIFVFVCVYSNLRLSYNAVQLSWWWKLLFMKL
jgi:hypothetical protein